MQRISSANTSFQGLIRLTTYTKAGEKMIKRTKKYNTTEAQDYAINYIGSSKTQMARTKLDSGDTNLLCDIIKKATGRTLPQTSSNNRYFSNFSDVFVYANENAKEEGGINILFNLKNAIKKI